MTQAFKAYCLTCPTAVGPYGQPVYEGRVFTDGDNPAKDALDWRLEHRASHPDHIVKVDRFEEFVLNVEYVNPDLWRILTGG